MYNFLMFSNIIDQMFQLLQFYEIVAFIDTLIFPYNFFLFLQFLIVIIVYFLSYIVLSLRKLFNSHMYSLLKLVVLILESLYLLIQHLHMLIVLFVLLECTIQLLLFNYQFIKQRVIVDQISALQFGISFQILVLFYDLLYLQLQLLALNRQIVQVVRLGHQILYSLLVPCQFGVVVLQTSLVSLFLILEKDQSPLLISAGMRFLLLFETSESFLFHMVQHLLIELFQTCSQFLVFFPDLDFIEFSIVGQFGHMFVSLGVGELGVGDGGQ